MKTVRTVQLILADTTNNNNKYWKADLFEDGSIHAEYGRVGKTPQTTKYTASRGGETFLDKKVREKEKKGYKELKVVASGGGGGKTTVVSDLKSVAKSQIETSGDPIVDELVKRLVKENIHNITSSTNITYNSASGLFQTPLGVVTIDAIEDARDLLVKMSPFVEKGNYGSKTFKNSINDYLCLVPQDIGMKKFDPESFFEGDDAIKRQLDILDSLEVSFDAVSKPTGKKKVKTEKVFDLSLSTVAKSDFERIKKLYHKTLNRIHACNHLDLKSAYVVRIGSMADGFEKGKSVGNVRELWHGTKTANLLSIMKSGLHCAPPSTASIAGKMYGNGVYFSDQSTKSLNYAYGYWSGSRDNNCFMFLADVAMGKEYKPTSRGYNSRAYPVKGFDSTFAEAGKGGVMNNEMIVYNDNQCNLTYLCEFSPRGK